MKFGCRTFVLTFLAASINVVALAAPLEIHGDIRLERMIVNDKITGDLAPVSSSGYQVQSLVEFEQDLNKNTQLFLRHSAIKTTDGILSRFDHYGVKHKDNNWDISLGRQSVILGQGTILGTGDSVIGNDNKFYGLVAKTKVGNADVQAIEGKTDGTVAPDGIGTKWYGIDFIYPVLEDLKIGGAWAYGKPDSSSEPGTYYYGMNTTLQITKPLALNAEYAKANTGKDAAYFINLVYKRAEDSLSVQYNDVKYAAVDQYNSAIGAISFPISGNNLTSGNNGYSGFSYIYTYNFSQALSLDINYMDLKVDGQTGRDKEWKIGLQANF